MTTYNFGHARLLRPDEEISLGREIQTGIEAKTQLEAGPAMSVAERRDCRRKVQKGLIAEKQFVEANVRLVRKAVRKMGPASCNEDDMMQDGMIALMRAVQKFDPERGFRFSTYAMNWLRQAVTRSSHTSRSVVRVAGPVRQKLRNISNVELELTQKLKREPTPEEVAAAVKIDVESLSQLRVWGRSPRSIDMPLRNDELAGMTLADTLVDHHNSELFEAAEQAGIKTVIEQIKSILTLEEQQLLEDHYLKDERQQRTMSKHDRHLLRRIRSKVRHPSSNVPEAAAAFLD